MTPQASPRLAEIGLQRTLRQPPHGSRSADSSFGPSLDRAQQRLGIRERETDDGKTSTGADSGNARRRDVRALPPNRMGESETVALPVTQHQVAAHATVDQLISDASAFEEGDEAVHASTDADDLDANSPLTASLPDTGKSSGASALVTTRDVEASFESLNGSRDGSAVTPGASTSLAGLAAATTGIDDPGDSPVKPETSGVVGIGDQRSDQHAGRVALLTKQAVTGHVNAASAVNPDAIPKHSQQVVKDRSDTTQLSDPIDAAKAVSRSSTDQSVPPLSVTPDTDAQDRNVSGLANKQPGNEAGATRPAASVPATDGIQPAGAVATLGQQALLQDWNLGERRDLEGINNPLHRSSAVLLPTAPPERFDEHGVTTASRTLDAAEAVSATRLVDADAGHLERADQAASIDRIARIAEQLRNSPPPRHLTIQLPEGRVRISVEEGQIRLTALDQHRDTRAVVDDTVRTLSQRGLVAQDDSPRQDQPGSDRTSTAAGGESREGSSQPHDGLPNNDDHPSDEATRTGVAVSNLDSTVLRL